MRTEFAASLVQCDRSFVLLWLHTAINPPLDEWAVVLPKLSEMRDALQAPVERIRQLVISDGGAPNALQRTMVPKEFASAPLAVITPVAANPIKRGIITALSWTNPAIRLYGPRDFLKALDFLELSEQRRRLWSEFQKLAARVKPQISLKLIETQALGATPSRFPLPREDCDTCAPTACTCLPAVPARERRKSV
jgi:hypothetical protein